MAVGLRFFIVALIFSIVSVCAAEKCIVCDSSNEKCATEPESVTPTECSSKRCFTTVENDGKISRGCFVDDKKCESTKNCTECTSADDKGCNTKKITLTCKSCDSTSDAICSTWSDASKIPHEFCADGITECIMKVKDDKNTERRCATKDEKCSDTESKTCSLCNASGCNKDVFPADRRKCYQCPSSSKCANPSANTDEIVSQPCKLYVEKDNCYAYGTSETDMTRGCESDKEDYTKCAAVGEKCLNCDTDNCNYNAFKYLQNLKCIQCKSDDESCAWGYEASDAKDCTNQISYWQHPGCYTNKIEAGKVARGCVHDIDCSGSTCTACSTNACNRVDAMDFTCYKCRSSENAACAKALDKDSFAAGACRNPVTKEGQGCYVENWNGIIIRSCLVDADDKTRKQCLNDNYSACKNCAAANCNSFDPPGNSAPRSLVAASSTLALIMMVLRFV